MTLVRNGTINVLQSAYGYHGGGDGFGSLGDLKTAIQSVWSPTGGIWIPKASYYYRYWPNNTAPGFVHGLKYVVNPDAFKRTVAAGLDPTTASDNQIAPYANHYFEFHNSTDRRASLEHVEGGTRQYSFAYTDSGNTDDYNHWMRQAHETRPDGSQKIVFSNHIAQVMLSELNDGLTPLSRWIDAYEFDDDAHQALHAMLSAIDT